MIENKDLGLKIAENSDVAFWNEMVTKCTKTIETMKRDIIINEHVIKLAKSKLKDLDL